PARSDVGHARAADRRGAGRQPLTDRSTVPRRSLLVAAMIAIGAVAAAQGFRFRGFGGERPNSAFVQPNPPYDGRFVFLRVNYHTAPGGFWYGGLPAWAHGYPLAEQTLLRILKEGTYIHTR